MTKPPELSQQLCARLMMAGAATPAREARLARAKRAALVGFVSNAHRNIGKICCTAATPPT